MPWAVLTDGASQLYCSLWSHHLSLARQNKCQGTCRTYMETWYLCPEACNHLCTIFELVKLCIPLFGYCALSTYYPKTLDLLLQAFMSSRWWLASVYGQCPLHSFLLCLSWIIIFSHCNSMCSFNIDAAAPGEVALFFKFYDLCHIFCWLYIFYSFLGK